MARRRATAGPGAAQPGAGPGVPGQPGPSLAAGTGALAGAGGPRKSSARSLWWIAAGLFGTALLAGGVVAGWAAANSLAVADQDRAIAETLVISLPDLSADASVRMPDVRGLSEQSARQTLVDAGLPAAAVAVIEQPAAGAPGRVIQQTPVFGTVNPATVSLVVSTGAEVPAAVGWPAADAVNELRSLGTRVEQVKVYEPGAAVGTVTAISPAPGTALPEVVTVYIADTPSTRLLTDFDRLRGSGSTRTDYLHLGQRFDTGMELSAAQNASATGTSWNLEGRATTIEGSAAVAEGEDASFAAQLVVLGDGNELARLDLTSTTPTPFLWDVRGVQTVTIVVVTAGTARTGDIVLLDMEVLGSFDAMNAGPQP